MKSVTLWENFSTLWEVIPQWFNIPLPPNPRGERDQASLCSSPLTLIPHTYSSSHTSYIIVTTTVVIISMVKLIHFNHLPIQRNPTTACCQQEGSSVANVVVVDTVTVADVVEVHLKLGHKSAAVPNVHHHCLHPRVFSQLPVKRGRHCHYHHRPRPAFGRLGLGGSSVGYSSCG